MKAFKQYYLDVIFKQYRDISGRTSRREYWLYILFWGLIWFIVNWLFVFTCVSIFGVRPMPESIQNPLMSYAGILYCLFTLMPSLSLVIRRLHDAGASGKWSILVLVPHLSLLFIIGFGIISGTPSDRYNKYGQ